MNAPSITLFIIQLVPVRRVRVVQGAELEGTGFMIENDTSPLRDPLRACQ